MGDFKISHVLHQDCTSNPHVLNFRFRAEPYSTEIQSMPRGLKRKVGGPSLVAMLYSGTTVQMQRLVGF